MRTPRRPADRPRGGGDHAAVAALVARSIAVARIGIGLAATLAPRAAARYLFRDAGGGLPVSVQMLGARDLALGLGAVMAARRSPTALRGWVEAGVIADAVDALAFTRADGTGVRLRRLTALIAGTTALCGAWAARGLTAAATAAERDA